MPSSASSTRSWPAPTNTLIAGHKRLLAARKLGLETADLVLEHLSETQRRALIIADNKLAKNAGWDDELLAGTG
ncbi:hypothetical protein U5801_26670 [Lamprobacter modestohalophilus]|uniref:hypothetical protein n=1 Tax=Lamprobacter modestohalophilus TaxID=1064514 RepID=UPI002ADEBF6A|nr:hypothetical protein [Lamprobacter modestohalophilus]MEA1053360.1 hypothetical protein [Lamprobacter modestohalophilus]